MPRFVINIVAGLLMAATICLPLVGVGLAVRWLVGW